MRITENVLRSIIREELKRHLDEGVAEDLDVLVEGVLSDLSGKVSQGAAIGLMMLSLTGTASGQGFLNHMNNTIKSAASQESESEKLEVKGIGNLQKVQDELLKKLRANPFGGHNILSDYVKKFEDMGEAGNKIMKEVLSLFKKSPNLKKRYSLVYRAFEQMSNDIKMNELGI